MPANDHLGAQFIGDYGGSHTPCDHCGRIVPVGETSEGMCSTCGDDPIPDLVRELHTRSN